MDIWTSALLCRWTSGSLV